MGAALTTPERADTARWCGFGKQGRKAYVRNQRVKPLNRPTSSNLADMGWVAARTERRCAGRELLAGADAPRREATVNAYGVVVAMPLGQSWAPTPSIGCVVNVGTEPSPVSCALPLLGTAQVVPTSVEWEIVRGSRVGWRRRAGLVGACRGQPRFPLVLRARLGTWWWR